VYWLGMEELPSMGNHSKKVRQRKKQTAEMAF
jgi:hypothetical protein